MARRVARRVAWLVVAAAVVPACSTSPHAVPEERAVTAAAPVSYDELVEAYNRRAARLARIWSRGTVSLKWTDENGRRRWEQGDTAFQYVLDPPGFALSAEKLGEVLVWLGYDADAYWLIDAHESKAAYTGRHELLRRDRASELGMPAMPLELPVLMGIAPIPTSERLGGEPRMEWAADGRSVMVELPHRDGGWWRLRIDVAWARATHVQLVQGGRTVIDAELQAFAPVRITGEGGFYPEVASIVTIRHEPSEAEMKISLDTGTMQDGRSSRGKLHPRAFDFDLLTAALGPLEVVNLDEEAHAQAPGRP